MANVISKKLVYCFNTQHFRIITRITTDRFYQDIPDVRDSYKPWNIYINDIFPYFTKSTFNHLKMFLS